MSATQEATTDEVGDDGAVAGGGGTGGRGEVECEGEDNLALIPGCQVPRHPTPPDHDYIARSHAPVLTVRLCPSAGGLRLIGGGRGLGIIILLNLPRDRLQAYMAIGPTEWRQSLLNSRDYKNIN
jgi:hypothetical protein